MNQLAKEIQEQSSQIYRDAYQMSIGELINIYKDGEMEIHPEFQRVYRWTSTQKTRLIESILLNIPIPSIFVSQDESGVWDIVDGVQRLSTIFQFVGILLDDDNKPVDHLVLEKTKYLPSLEGYVWESKEDTELKEIVGKGFTPQQRIDFKRARIDIVIVKKESDPKTKYELFQRLNTGGTKLSEQEVRNCLIIMTNRTFYENLVNLDKNEAYNVTTQLLTDKKIDEQYRKELVLRLMVACNIDWNGISEYTDFFDMLDQESIKIADSKDFNYDVFNNNYERTFAIISRALGEDAYRRYDESDDKFIGALLNGAFQAISFGVLSNLNFVEAKGSEWLNVKVKNMYKEAEFIRNMEPGVRAIPRFKDLSAFGLEYFKS